MKLYTEEQITELLKEIFKNDFNKGADIIPIILGKELTPIELPSDDEITDKALEIGYTNNLFTLGAKWMRDKIQGGSK